MRNEETFESYLSTMKAEGLAVRDILRTSKSDTDSRSGNKRGLWNGAHLLQDSSAEAVASRLEAVVTISDDAAHTSDATAPASASAGARTVTVPLESSFKYPRDRLTLYEIKIQRRHAGPPHP
jgi:hypothetical protein